MRYLPLTRLFGTKLILIDYSKEVKGRSGIPSRNRVSSELALSLSQQEVLSWLP
jgi:hypothetical protein